MITYQLVVDGRHRNRREDMFHDLDEAKAAAEELARNLPHAVIGINVYPAQPLQGMGPWRLDEDGVWVASPNTPPPG